jgi:hypothetical protein
MADENYIPFYKKGGADTRVNYEKPDKDYLGSSNLIKGGLNVSNRPDFVKTNEMLENSTKTKPGSGTNTKPTKGSSTQTTGNTYASSSDGTGGLVQSTKPNNNPQTTAASLEGTGNKSASNSSWTFNKSTKETVVALNDRKAMRQEFRRRKKTGYDPQGEGKIVSDYASKDDKGAYKSGTTEWGRLDEKNKRLADKLNKKLDKKLDKPTGSRSKLFKTTSGNNKTPNYNDKNNASNIYEVSYKPGSAYANPNAKTSWSKAGLNEIQADAKKEYALYEKAIKKGNTDLAAQHKKGYEHFKKEASKVRDLAGLNKTSSISNLASNNTRTIKASM